LDADSMPARQRTILVTFATEGFYGQQKWLNDSAREHGVSESAAWTDVQLRLTDFYRDNRQIFASRRGFGYWLWKPYVILHALERANPGDFIIYYDVGRREMPHEISRPLEPLLEWCAVSNGGMLPGVYVPEHGPNMKWTKRECFVLMDCDSATYWRHPQIQATFSVWQKSERSMAFVAEWLKWCCNPAVLTDAVHRPELANFPEFVDHRHDQSVITLLALRHGVRAYGSPDRVLPGSKDINNLVDRIEGKEISLALRTLQRVTERRIRTRWSMLQRRLRSFVPSRSSS
jgi:hypothetical protein